MTTWTKITKATGPSWTNIAKAAPDPSVTIQAGTPIGLLLALTYATTQTTTKGWTDIPKATGTSWTKITKAV